jgi:hypothetical protein
MSLMTEFLGLRDYSDSQISFADSFYADPDYPIDSYVSSRVHQVVYSTFRPIIPALHSDSKVNSSGCIC